MQVSDNLKKIVKELGKNVNLVAVTKTQPTEIIMEAYTAGHRVFGENKVQELDWKYNELPKDIEWHLIGRLQTNKIKNIVSYIGMIQGVDSKKLLYEINKEAAKVGRIIPCLLQVKIARENTKFGLSEDDLYDLIQNIEVATIQNITIAGLMGMATFTDNQAIIRAEFRKLYTIFNTLKTGYFKDKASFCELSMGMSSDYKIAIEEGSTMVRIGSLIFGERIYS